MKADITIDSLFAGKLLVLFYCPNEEDVGSEEATCLGRDAAGILLNLGKGVIAYYPWHRIERIIPDIE